MQVEQVYRQKWRYKKVMKIWRIFFLIIFNSFWLGFQILQFFKVIYLGLQASDWLISINLWSQKIFVYFGRMFVYFLRKYLLLISTTVDFRKFKKLVSKIFSTFKGFKNFKVNLLASCTSNWQKELNLWSH